MHKTARISMLGKPNGFTEKVQINNAALTKRLVDEITPSKPL